jgi:hypothetical protein
MSYDFPKPLSIDNLNNLKDRKKQEFDFFFIKTKILGFFLSLVGIITIMSQNWFPEFLYAPLIGGLLAGLGITLLLVKFLITNLTDIDMLMYAKYQDAPRNLVHECEAFISMPEMEPWKKFVDEIKSQNRQILIFECELIKSAWQHKQN